MKKLLVVFVALFATAAFAAETTTHMNAKSGNTVVSKSKKAKKKSKKAKKAKPAAEAAAPAPEAAPPAADGAAQ